MGIVEASRRSELNARQFRVLRCLIAFNYTCRGLSTTRLLHCARWVAMDGGCQASISRSLPRNELQTVRQTTVSRMELAYNHAKRMGGIY